MYEEHVISIAQYSFMKGISFESALLKLTSSLFLARDQGKFSAVASFDLSRAFDTVNYHFLASKLKNFGLNDGTCA